MMEKLFQSTCLAPLLLLTIAFNARLANAGPHTHGVGKLDIGQRGHIVKASFVLPMESLVGFEHIPKTPAQKTAVEQLQVNLSKENALMQFSPAVQCKQTALQYNSSSVHGQGHADVIVEIQFQCQNTSSLGRIDFEVFKQYPKLKQIDVQWINQKEQRKFVLKTKQPFLNL
jgi:hypothetical protein